MSDENFERIVESVFKNSKKTIAKEVQDRFVTRKQFLLTFLYYNMKNIQQYTVNRGYERSRHLKALSQI